MLAHPELDRLTIAHLDCDAFYAAIEKRDDPSLAEQPVISTLHEARALVDPDPKLWPA